MLSDVLIVASPGRSPRIECAGGVAGRRTEADTVHLISTAATPLGGDTVTLGSPLVSGASVAAEIVEHRRASTILVFKKRRRQNSKRSRGHRQHHTVVKIKQIVTGGSSAQAS